MQISAAAIEMLTGDDCATAYTKAIKGAKDSILLSCYMISHHWRDDKAYKINLVDTLCEASLRGVRCRGIVDQPNVQGRREPFNWQAAKQMSEAGWKMRCIPDETTLHEKVTTIDGLTVFVGSHNISRASACTNIDCSLSVVSGALANATTRHFWETWRIASSMNFTGG